MARDIACPNLGVRLRTVAASLPHFSIKSNASRGKKRDQFNIKFGIADAMYSSFAKIASVSRMIHVQRSPAARMKSRPLASTIGKERNIY